MGSKTKKCCFCTVIFISIASVVALAVFLILFLFTTDNQESGTVAYDQTKGINTNMTKDPDILTAPLLSSGVYTIGDKIEITFTKNIDCSDPHKYYLYITLYGGRQYYDISKLNGKPVVPGLYSICNGTSINVYLTSLINFYRSTEGISNFHICNVFDEVGKFRRGCKTWNFSVNPVKLAYVSSQFQIENINITLDVLENLRSEISKASMCPKNTVVFESITNSKLQDMPIMKAVKERNIRFRFKSDGRINPWNCLHDMTRAINNLNDEGAELNEIVESKLVDNSDTLSGQVIQNNNNVFDKKHLVTVETQTNQYDNLEKSSPKVTPKFNDNENLEDKESFSSPEESQEFEKIQHREIDVNFEDHLGSLKKNRVTENNSYKFLSQVNAEKGLLVTEVGVVIEPKNSTGKIKILVILLVLLSVLAVACFLTIFFITLSLNHSAIKSQDSSLGLTKSSQHSA